jgi:hypothetical protein
LGKGKIQKQAIDEVLSLPKDDPLRNLVLELIASWTTRTEKLENRRRVKEVLPNKPNSIFLKPNQGRHQPQPTFSLILITYLRKKR